MISTFCTRQEHEAIRLVSFGQPESDDFWAWTPDPYGHFFVKSAYHTIRSTSSPPDSPVDSAAKAKWKWLWNLNFPPKPQGCVFVLDVVAACSNDYEDGDVDFKRGSNGLSGRKRRVVFDDSDDECEDAVNLSSGDIVNGQTNKPVAGTGEKHDTVMQDERKSDVGVGSRSVNAASSAPSKCGETKTSRAETMGSCIVQNDVKDNASSNIVPSSSKRNKVMKTWIDERGREGRIDLKLEMLFKF
ncbi:hypothetical protein LINPERPRIM_LOCUS36895 [Linum perenne]